MRRSIVVALALAGALVAAGAALAANRYAVSRVVVKPSDEGAPKRPAPVEVRFGLRVREADRDLRPAATQTYSIAVEGLVNSTRGFPTCSVRRVGRGGRAPRACAKAKVGGGVIKVAAGLMEDRTMESSIPCNLRLGVYNTGRGMALRLDGDPPQPPSFRSRRFGCPVRIHAAVPGRLVKTRIDGRRSTDLRFSVPSSLLHPLEGWEGAVQSVSATLDLRTRRAGGRTIGLYSSVGCAGGNRTVEATFGDEQGGSVAATRTVRC